MYIRDRRKRGKKLAEWMNKFIKIGLLVTFLALVIWWLLHMFGDMQDMITTLQDQANQQNLQINELQSNLQATVQENSQLKIKINGLEQYVVEQNEVIQDLKGQLNQPSKEFNTVQPQLGEDQTSESKPGPGEIISPAILVPVIIGAFEIGRRLISPGSMIFGGM